MLPDARTRLRAAIARKNAERGLPLTAREKLMNLEAGLGYAPGTAPWWPRPALATAARQGGDVKQAPAESPQSGDAKQRNAQTPQSSGPAHD